MAKSIGVVYIVRGRARDDTMFLEKGVGLQGVKKRESGGGVFTVFAD